MKNAMFKSPIFDDLTKSVKAALIESQKGKEFIQRWSDRQIKAELKEPCFFGVKNPIRKLDYAIKHFKKIAGVQE